MELNFSSYEDRFDYLEEVYVSFLNDVFSFLNLKAEAIVSVSLIDNETIHEINRDYRNVDRVTDVISFAFLDDEPNRDTLLKSKKIVDLGEIYICIPQAIKQAEEYGHSLERELDFLFVHGLLHLLGYDHMSKEDEEIMFSLQEKILDNRGVKR